MVKKKKGRKKKAKGHKMRKYERWISSEEIQKISKREKKEGNERAKYEKEKVKV